MANKILVVDDELDFIELVKYHLTAPEYRVLSATNGTDALNTVWQHAPDAILMDLLLPDLDGLTLCEILQRNSSTRDIPVIMITAVSTDVTRFSAQVAGAREFFPKPVDYDRLKARLKTLLARGSLDPKTDGLSDAGSPPESHQA
jgi:DNA-binding response OmpR family regulator